MPDEKRNPERTETVPLTRALLQDGAVRSAESRPDTVPYWRGEAARWRRHAAHFEDLAHHVAADLHGTVAPSLRPPYYVDFRSSRFWWFNHMAALYMGWASRAEDRLAHLLTPTRPIS